MMGGGEGEEWDSTRRKSTVRIWNFDRLYKLRWVSKDVKEVYSSNRTEFYYASIMK